MTDFTNNSLSLLYPDHEGTRIFLPLTEITKLPPEQINLMAAYIISMIFGTVLRDKMPLTKIQPIVRHLFSIFGGVFMMYFCFGKVCVIHFLIASTVCFLLMNSKLPNWHDLTFFFMMGYLVIAMVFRADGLKGMIGWSFHFQGLVCHLTSLAYSVQDSREFGKIQRKSLPNLRKNHCGINNTPTFIQFYSYALSFMNVIGHFKFYDDYINHIENDNREKGKSRMWKTIGQAVCYFITYNFVFQFFPNENLLDISWIKAQNPVYLTFYAQMSVWFGTRCMIYTAWCLAAAGEYAQGYGYYFDKEKEVEVVTHKKFSLMMTLKAFTAQEIMNCWNMTTGTWLRYVMYERRSKTSRTGCTFVLSSVWHGITPGNITTFVSWWLFTESHRRVRYLTKDSDILNGVFMRTFQWIIVQVLMIYVSSTFRIDTFEQIFVFYKTGCFWGYIVLGAPFLMKKSWFGIDKEIQTKKLN